MTPRPLDPKEDLVFRLLFQREELLLCSMIEAVLDLPAPPVSVRVLNPDLPPEIAEGKGCVLDLRVELNDGTQLDVEMQTQARPGMAKRFLYYWARLYGAQLERGAAFGLLKRAVSIIWLAEPLAREAPFHVVYHVVEDRSGHRLADDLEVHLLQLPLLGSADVPPKLARWARFFLATSEEEVTLLASDDQVMQKARDALKHLSNDGDAQVMLEQRRTYELFQRHVEASLREEGREEGRTVGREEGREAGRLDGAKAALETMAAALGLAIDDELRARIERLDAGELERWIAAVARDRAFPR